MNRQFLSCLAVGLFVSGFVACEDDEDDDAQSTQTTGASTRSTSSTTTGSGGGSTTGRATGSGGTGATSDTNGANGTTSGITGGTGGGDGGDGGDGGIGGEGGMAGAAALSDEEILHVVRTANAGEVAQAEIALMRANDADVIDFAEMMVEDHSAALTEADALADAEGWTPQPNPVSAMLRAESANIVSMLMSASDAEFDAVYMNSQVMAHEEVLTLLDDALIAEADDADLETFLSELQTHVAEHLDSAESIVDALE